MTSISNKWPAGAVEQAFRLFDKAATSASAPMCQTNLVCLVEFETEGQEIPTANMLRELIEKHLCHLPCLTHFLKEDNDGQLYWASYEPNLDNIILSKKIPLHSLENEITTSLASRLPYDMPWKLILLYGYAEGKISILCSVRHEIMDGGAVAETLSVLFGKNKNTKKAISLPSPQEALKIIPTEFIQASPVEEKSLFWNGISPTLKRKNTILQMPSRLLPEIGKKLGVSGNDIYLFTMGRAFWKWAQKYRNTLPDNGDFSLLVPVNLRLSGEHCPGSCFYLAKITLSQQASIEELVKQTDILRQKTIRESLAALYKENSEIALNYMADPKLTACASSSFRITESLGWGEYPLVRMVQSFNSLAGRMPMYSMFSTYEPKNIEKGTFYSILFFSMDDGIDGLSEIPNLWVKELHKIAEQTGQLNQIKNCQIEPFC
ncbi:hypothetical protein FAI40_08235 [Acetobacteraceae bacterium]|nr:hypothetical protein FAI40_08235 [Acetobacteraceae bacterium]